MIKSNQFNLLLSNNCFEFVMNLFILTNYSGKHFLNFFENFCTAKSLQKALYHLKNKVYSSTNVYLSL